MKTNVALIIAMASIGIAPVAQAKGVLYAARISARHAVAPNGEKVGISNFAGKDGQQFANVLNSILTAATLDGKAVLTMSRQPDVIIGGSVLDSNIYSERYTESRRECTNYKKVFKCESWQTISVDCEKIRASYSVTITAMRVADRNPVFSQNVNVLGRYKVCDGKFSDAKFEGMLPSGSYPEYTANASTPTELLGQLRRFASLKVREMVAPYNMTVEVKFMEGRAKLAKDVMQKYKSALAFGKAGRVDRACGTFDEIYADAANQQDVELNYNQGVCQEVLLPDDPSEAQRYYLKAEQLLDKPDSMVSKAVDRLKLLTQESARIN